MIWSHFQSHLIFFLLFLHSVLVWMMDVQILSKYSPDLGAQTRILSNAVHTGFKLCFFLLWSHEEIFIYFFTAVLLVKLFIHWHTPLVQMAAATWGEGWLTVVSTLGGANIHATTYSWNQATGNANVMSNGSGGVLIYAVDCWPQFDTNPFFSDGTEEDCCLVFTCSQTPKVHLASFHVIFAGVKTCYCFRPPSWFELSTSVFGRRRTDSC